MELMEVSLKALKSYRSACGICTLLYNLLNRLIHLFETVTDFLKNTFSKELLKEPWRDLWKNRLQNVLFCQTDRGNLR